MRVVLLVGVFLVAGCAGGAWVVGERVNPATVDCTPLTTPRNQHVEVSHASVGGDVTVHMNSEADTAHVYIALARPVQRRTGPAQCESTHIVGGQVIVYEGTCELDTSSVAAVRQGNDPTIVRDQALEACEREVQDFLDRHDVTVWSPRDLRCDVDVEQCR